MTFMKRFLIFCGLIILATLYYLLASLNILQFFKTFPGGQHPALNVLLVEITNPLALSGICITAYLAGLIFRGRKAAVWSERLILICALIAVLPFVLPLFVNTQEFSNPLVTREFTPYQKKDETSIKAESSQSNFDSLHARASGGDPQSMLTLANLYCGRCDAAVKLDLRAPEFIAAKSEDLSRYKKPDEDIGTAFMWYSTAAQTGNLKAKNIVGEMLVRGVGVLQDMKKALQLFSEAAKEGYVPAQFNLAAMYEYGYGVDKDIPQAHMWYNIIAGSAKDHADEDALYARNLRDSLETKMATNTVAKATENARLCLESKFQSCH